MIELRGVSKGYRLGGHRRQVIARMSFALPPGRNLAVMGPNGAGKSTLLRLISGAEAPDRGRVIRRGRVSWALGFAGCLNGAMTGVDNIRFVARLHGKDPRWMQAEVARLSGLGAELSKPVRNYSTGMRARLSFGLSFALEFDLYLIDEILAVGDAAFQRCCHEVFAERLGSAQLIMASHSEETLRRYCECGIYLAGGQAQFFDNLDDLFSMHREDRALSLAG
ncbi:MAG: ATP-binding cassette domain-containing protein [Rhodobacteraceae bacterium]|nr:ATP-binding cassette domain-containing protein [Paracoccaceae bacterium]